MYWAIRNDSFTKQQQKHNLLFWVVDIYDRVLPNVAHMPYSWADF